MRRFDQKFGPELLESVPAEPGVYRFLDASGAVLYVGKARNLRRRLSQYRLAGPGKRGRKPRKIVKAASALTWEVHASELEASLAEVRLIQALKPPLNIAGAFDFLYPMVGIGRVRDAVRFAYTTRPEELTGFELHGAYRSRDTTAEAFYALMRLLRRVGHPENLPAAKARMKRTRVHGLRRLPDGWDAAWAAYFRGEDASVLGVLAVMLLEKPSARKEAAEVEDDLKSLRRFFKEEARPLADAVRATGYTAWPVPQCDRDPLFVRHRASG